MPTWGRSRSLEHKLPPPAIAVLAACLMYLLARFPPQLALPAALKLASAGLLALTGLSVAALGILAFRRHATTVNPLQPDKATALVTDGIYRFTRNPMYLGMALLLSAWALYLSALWAFAGPIVFVLYISRFQIQPEERALAGLFGREYADYAGRVRRWL